MALVDDIVEQITRAEAAEVKLKEKIQQQATTIVAQQKQIADLQEDVANSIPTEVQNDIFNRTKTLASELEADVDIEAPAA